MASPAGRHRRVPQPTRPRRAHLPGHGVAFGSLLGPIDRAAALAARHALDDTRRLVAQLRIRGAGLPSPRARPAGPPPRAAEGLDHPDKPDRMCRTQESPVPVIPAARVAGWTSRDLGALADTKCDALLIAAHPMPREPARPIRKCDRRWTGRGTSACGLRASSSNRFGGHRPTARGGATRGPAART